LSSCFLSKNLKIKINRTTVLLVFVGVKLSLSILREEHRLRVFEKSVLRRIFGPMMEEGVGGWRILHNEFCNLHVSPNIIWVIKSRRMRWT
jgi:hypothetical protein